MKEITANLMVGSNCKVDNSVYFFNRTFNGLFYINLEDYTIQYVHSFSCEKITGDNLSLGRSLIYQNEIYFFPNNGARYIMKFDINRRQENLIPVPLIEGKPLNVVEVKQLGTQLYIFPSDIAKGIYVLDLCRQIITKDEELSALFKDEFTCSNDVIAFCEDSIFIAIQGTNAIVEINLRTKKIVNQIRLKKDIQIYSIKYDDSHFWILQTKSTDVYEWDKEHDILQKYIYEPEQREDIGERAYSNMIFLDDEILVFTYSQKNILRINKREKTIGEPLKLPKEFRCVIKVEGTAMFGPYTITENKVFIYPGKGNMMLIYDRNTRKITGKELMITEKEIPMIREVLKDFFSGGKVHMERDDIGTLEEFICTIESIRNKNKIQNIREVGHTIYQECLLI